MVFSNSVLELYKVLKDLPFPTGRKASSDLKSCLMDPKISRSLATKQLAEKRKNANIEKFDHSYVSKYLRAIIGDDDLIVQDFL